MVSMHLVASWLDRPEKLSFYLSSTRSSKPQLCPVRHQWQRSALIGLLDKMNPTNSEAFVTFPGP
jgi:hypothetical protein